MDEAHAYNAPALLKAQALDQVDCIEITAPNEDPDVAEFLSNKIGWDAFIS